MTQKLPPLPPPKRGIFTSPKTGEEGGKDSKIKFEEEGEDKLKLYLSPPSSPCTTKWY